MIFFSKRFTQFPYRGYLHLQVEAATSEKLKPAFNFRPIKHASIAPSTLSKKLQGISTARNIETLQVSHGIWVDQGNFSLDATPLEADFATCRGPLIFSYLDGQDLLFARWECRAHCPTLEQSWSWGRNTWCASLLTCRVLFLGHNNDIVGPSIECLVRISVRPLSSHTYDGHRHVGEIIIESLVFGDEISTQAALLFGLGCIGQTEMTFALILRWSRLVAVDMVIWKVPSSLFYKFATTTP